MLWWDKSLANLVPRIYNYAHLWKGFLQNKMLHKDIHKSCLKLHSLDAFMPMPYCEINLGEKFKK
jgi:hypothetical protein